MMAEVDHQPGREPIPELPESDPGAVVKMAGVGLLMLVTAGPWGAATNGILYALGAASGVLIIVSWLFPSGTFRANRRASKALSVNAGGAVLFAAIKDLIL